jgi:hypothetical protein
MRWRVGAAERGMTAEPPVNVYRIVNLHHDSGTLKCTPPAVGREDALMHDAQLLDATGPSAAKVPETPPAAALLYWNPCLGMPLIVIESPLLFFGIQITVGILCLVVLLIEPFRPAGCCMGGLP